MTGPFPEDKKDDALLPAPPQYGSRPRHHHRRSRLLSPLALVCYASLATYGAYTYGPAAYDVAQAHFAGHGPASPSHHDHGHEHPGHHHGGHHGKPHHGGPPHCGPPRHGPPGHGPPGHGPPGHGPPDHGPPGHGPPHHGGPPPPPHHGGPPPSHHGGLPGRHHGPPGEHGSPFYVPHQLVRSDIANGQNGTALELEFKVVDADTDEPVEGVAVDIWHADAHAHFSGIPPPPHFPHGRHGPHGPKRGHGHGHEDEERRGRDQGPSSRRRGGGPGSRHRGPSGQPARDADREPAQDDKSDKHDEHKPKHGKHHREHRGPLALRGVQFTDKDGLVKFDSILPAPKPCFPPRHHHHAEDGEHPPPPPFEDVAELDEELVEEEFATEGDFEVEPARRPSFIDALWGRGHEKRSEHHGRPDKHGRHGRHGEHGEHPDCDSSKQPREVFYKLHAAGSASNETGRFSAHPEGPRGEVGHGAVDLRRYMDTDNAEHAKSSEVAIEQRATADGVKVSITLKVSKKQVDAIRNGEYPHRPPPPPHEEAEMEAVAEVDEASWPVEIVVLEVDANADAEDWEETEGSVENLPSLDELD